MEGLDMLKSSSTASFPVNTNTSVSCPDYKKLRHILIALRTMMYYAILVVGLTTLVLHTVLSVLVSLNLGNTVGLVLFLGVVYSCYLALQKTIMKLL